MAYTDGELAASGYISGVRLEYFSDGHGETIDNLSSELGLAFSLPYTPWVASNDSFRKRLFCFTKFHPVFIQKGDDNGMTARQFFAATTIITLVFGYFSYAKRVEHVLGQQNNIPADTTIVAVGDSITAGVGASSGNGYVDVLSRRLGHNIINLGRSGDSTADALARLDSDVIARDPDIVIIFLGGNDILNGVSQTTMFNNLRQIIERLQDSGAKVILVGIHSGVFSNNLENGFQSLAVSTGAIYVPNVLVGILGNSSLMADAIHPNDAGHALIAERILPYLQNTTNSLPQSESEPTGYCSVSVSPDYNSNGYLINWNASISNPNAATSTTYAWSGTDNATGTQSSLSKVYNSGGLKTATVTATSGGENIVLECSADLPNNFNTNNNQKLGGSCNPSVNGMTVYWNVSGYGGTSGTSTYEWSGTDNLTASSSSTYVNHTYTNPGIKEARVVIRGGSESLILTCEAQVAATNNNNDGGGCFIATAAFGTYMEPEVMVLREFRDEKLLTNKIGTKFVKGYYKYSPPIADFIRDRKPLKAMVRTGLNPIIYALGQD